MSTAFEQAAASYFGMPDTAQCAMQRDEDGLALHVRVLLTDAHLVAITARMVELAATAPALSDPVFVPMPTLQEVMASPERYVGVDGCQELLEKACKMSSAVRERVNVELKGNYGVSQD